jgi:DNA repair protein RecO (recombination protein O)
MSGLLEPFAEGRATLYLRPNRDLHTLSDFELIRERQALGTDLRRFGGASVLCELVLRLAPEHADQRLFSTLVEGLDRLLDVRSEEVPGVAVAVIWRLVGALGFLPMLEECQRCGEHIDDRAAAFDVDAGGLVCSRCRPGGSHLDREELTQLRVLVAGELPATPVDSQQLGLLTAFIRYHAAEGYRLRSLDFLTFSDGS